MNWINVAYVFLFGLVLLLLTPFMSMSFASDNSELDAIIVMTKDPDPQQRELGYKRFEDKYNDSKNVNLDFFLQGLEDPDMQVRIEAINSFGLIGRKIKKSHEIFQKVKPIIVKRLSDSDIRSWAAEIISKTTPF